MIDSRKKVLRLLMERDAFELVEKLGFIRVPCIVVVELAKTKSLMRVDVELGC